MTQNPKNHYQTLGLPRTATTADILRAFRSLAKAHHPDISRDPNATRNFQEILLAYKTLSNEEERRRYERTLKPAGAKRPAAKPVQKQTKKQPTAAPDPKRICPSCHGTKNPEYETCYSCRPEEERCPNCNRYKGRHWNTCYRCAFPRRKETKSR